MTTSRRIWPWQVIQRWLQFSFTMYNSEAWVYYCREEEHFRKGCDQSTEEIKITGESCLLFENQEAKSKRQHVTEMEMQAQAKEVRRQSVVEHSLLTSPQCMFMAKMVQMRDHLKVQNSFPVGKQQAPESCFCQRGSGANQEMQDESISKKQNKGKTCTQIQHRASQRDLNIGLTLTAKA